MQIHKKIKCLSCGTVILVNEKSNEKCTCQKVVIMEGHVQGIIGKDYIDVSPILLNETETFTSI